MGPTVRDGDPDVTGALVAEELPAQRGGAKAMLLTVLGEFVLPTGGSAWTSSLVRAAGALGIGEKNARQAIARIGEQGLLSSDRHGRQVRWSLTAAGRVLLETGTRRIYDFASSDVEWDGRWLVAHCPVAEPRRAQRTRLRTRLAFLGFGELSAHLLLSPHVDREPQLRAALHEAGLAAESTVLRSTTGSPEEDAALAARAWDLDELARAYHAFQRSAERSSPQRGPEYFRAVVELVHEWRRFPSVDPELPKSLLPDPWAGATAATTFRNQHRKWSSDATTWFSMQNVAAPSSA